MNLIKQITSMFRGTPKLDIASRFEILREAVSGTMSEFFKVREHSTGRTLGLKILDYEKQEFFASRFQGLTRPVEGAIATSMVHPCIVRSLEHGMVTTGQQYVLMEFLEGRGLNSAILDQDPMLEGKQLLLLRQMADALSCVHAAGYIHRDICPRNFIVAPDCRSLKLIDFGLTLPAKPEFMAPGNRTGTPNYMAPEIVRRRKTDQRVDIFSLGVTAYRLMAYELPWSSVEGTGRDALTHDTMAPTDLFERRPNINPELGNLIMSCIAKDPRSRPQTADDLLKELQKIKKVEA